MVGECDADSDRLCGRRYHEPITPGMKISISKALFTTMIVSLGTMFAGMWLGVRVVGLTGFAVFVVACTLAIAAAFSQNPRWHT